MNTITASTEAALECDLLKAIREKCFCIVGCGAVGSVFSEMLVRTGSTKIKLIDGDKIERKNLNRGVGFLDDDVGKYKVCVQAKYLERINPRIEKPVVVMHHFGKRYPGDEDTQVQKARDLIVDSDVVVIAMDNNDSRILCEQLCREFNKDYLSIGIIVDKKEKLAFYECTWKPKTPEEKRDDQDYGPGNGSFASIVLEATAVGFNLMLHHLQSSNNTEYKGYEKKYLNFRPGKECLKL